MLFLRRDDREKICRDTIEQGAVYRRERRYNVVELAEVLWVGLDLSGIPHVRFQLSYLGSEFADEQSTRMLALASFAALYGPHPEACAAS